MAATSVDRWRVVPEEQERRPRRHGSPAHEVPPAGPVGDHRHGGRDDGGRRRCRRAAGDHGTDEEKGGEGQVPGGPPASLVGQTERPLDHQRVGEQPDEAASVARGVEHVRVDARRHRPVPPLERRGHAGQGDERRPDGDCHRERSPGHGRAGGWPPPLAQTDRQGDHGEQHEPGRGQRVPPERETAGPEVGEQVAAEQQHLEREHRRVPHRGAAAQDRQERPRHQRLHEEQEPRRHEGRDSEQGGQPDRSLRPRPLRRQPDLGRGRGRRRGGRHAWVVVGGPRRLEASSPVGYVK